MLCLSDDVPLEMVGWLQDTREHFADVPDEQIAEVKAYAAAVAGVPPDGLKMTHGRDFLYVFDARNHIFINTSNHRKGEEHMRVVQGEMEWHFSKEAGYDIVQIGC